MRRKKNKYFYTKLIIFSFLIFLLFQQFFEALIDKLLISPFFKYITTNLKNDIIFYVFIAYLFYITYQRHKNKYKPSISISILLLLVTTLYYYYRNINDSFMFSNFKSINFIKYGDIIYIYFILYNSLWISYIKKNIRKENENTFILEKPINGFDKDFLGYENYVNSLSNMLTNSSFDKAFAVGISGKWGSGKTSFSNLIKNKLSENKNNIIFDFNAWTNKKPSDILKEFFINFQKNIEPYYFSISLLLKKYSDLLLSLNKSFSAFISPNFTASELYDEIDSLLKKSNKKIFIFIDDLDRLNNREIIEILRLIRNTANFSNTYFIVNYDKNYVINAIASQNIYESNKYLEKIFQIEINLPSYNKNLLKEKLAQLLKERLPKEYHKEIDDTIVGNYLGSTKYLDNWIKNYRDVIRLTNSILLNGKKIWGEVDFRDFFRIELLRTNYQPVYDLLHKNKKDFFKIDKENNNKYQLIQESSSYKFDQYLTKHKDEYNIDEIDITNIKNLLDGLFNPSSYLSLGESTHLSIRVVNRFNIYFSYGLDNNRLSEIDFLKAQNLNFKDYLIKINEWIERKLENDLKERFYNFDEFIDKNHFEKNIKAIFHLANQKSKLFGRIIGFDMNNLYYHKLNNYNNKLAKYYYNGSFKKLKDFYQNLFNNAEFPYIYESELLDYIKNNNFNDEFVLKNKEIQQITYNYLKNYCEKSKKLDDIFWHLLHSTKKIEYIEGSQPKTFRKKITVPANVKRLVKKCINNKGVDFFIYSIITREPFNHKSYTISEVVLQIFNNWKSFNQEISKIENSNSKYIDEFKIFLNEFIKKGANGYVKFDFNSIPINEK